MKEYKKIVSGVLLITTMLISNSCKDLLVEKPQSNIVPSAFSTPSGLLSGISGVYNDIRSAYGTEGFTVAQMSGTDEQLEGGGSSSYHRLCTYNGITGADFSGGFNWYTDINALNGILQLGPTTSGLDPATLKAYLGQAQFLRAFLYFYLVQTYGNIPLHTTFITVPSQADAPAAPNDVYKVIVQDLTDAISNLPNTPTAPFLGKAATVGAAKWLLAKVYLTRGWLNSDNNDFTLARNTADDLIANAGTYGFGLWQDYASAFLPANDYGKETIFVSDHSNDPKYGYYNPGGQQAGGGAINVTPWMGLGNMISNVGVNYVLKGGKLAAPATAALGSNPTTPPDYFVYPNNDPYKSRRGCIAADRNGNPINLTLNGLPLYVQPNPLILNRDTQFGRPFGRIRPNMSYLLNEAFSDRLNDSRYSKTFQTVWLENAAMTYPQNATKDTIYATGGGGGNLVTGTYSGNGVTGSRGTLKAGVDTAVWFPDYEVVGAPQAKGSWKFKGIIITPSMYNGNVYPYMKKLADPSRVSQNDPSTRPVVVARFSEVYLIAAEAAFKLGDNGGAAGYLTTIRTRAAYRSGTPYAPGGAFGTSTPATMVGDPYPSGVTAGSAIAAMTVTPAQVTLDFILDERSREFYGESVRWLDLVRTKTLVNRVQAWNLEASPNIQPFHMLRPIPLDEQQAVTLGPGYPQNPGY